MRAWVKSQRRWFAFGAIGAMAVAGVAVAVVVWTASVPNNQVTSPPIEPELVLGVAVAADPSECATITTYEEVSSTSIFAGATLDYTNPSVVAASSVVSGQYLCVKNTSSSTIIDGGLFVGFGDSGTDIVSTEAGACTDAEVTAGDTTCADGEQGELEGALYFELQGLGGPCDLSAAEGILQGGAFIAVSIPTGPLDPGESCAFDVILRDYRDWNLIGPPDPVYSTDTLTFPIIFYGDDGT